jgi:hypothetical protein
VTGLDPKHPYLLALSDRPDGAAPLQALSSFTTNPAGAAIVNAVGPIRQIVHGDAGAARRYLVIVTGSSAEPGKVVQVQAQDRMQAQERMQPYEGMQSQEQMQAHER